MKRLVLLLLLLQPYCVWPMQDEDSINESDILYEEALNKILEGIDEAKTRKELEEAYKLSEFSNKSKKHKSMVIKAQSSNEVQEAYMKKTQEIGFPKINYS